MPNRVHPEEAMLQDVESRSAETRWIALLWTRCGIEAGRNSNRDWCVRPHFHSRTETFGCLGEIGNEFAPHLLTSGRIGNPQDRRRVPGGHAGLAGLDALPLTMLLRDAKPAPQKLLGGSGAQAHDYGPTNGRDLCIKPGATGGQFAGGRLLMESP